MDDAQKESQIDPKHALITLVAGVAVRYYLMDVIKLLIILAILLGDASFVTVLYVRYHSVFSLHLWLGCCFLHDFETAGVVKRAMRDLHPSLTCPGKAIQS